MIPIHILLDIVVTVLWLSILRIVIKIQLPTIHLSRLLVSFRALLAVQLECSSFDIPIVLEFCIFHSDWRTPLEHLKILG